MPLTSTPLTFQIMLVLEVNPNFQPAQNVAQQLQEAMTKLMAESRLTHGTELTVENWAMKVTT